MYPEEDYSTVVKSLANDDDFFAFFQGFSQLANIHGYLPSKNFSSKLYNFLIFSQLQESFPHFFWRNLRKRSFMMSFFSTHSG